MSLYQHLSPAYQEEVFGKWKNVINAYGEIKDVGTAVATAMILENTQREFDAPAARRQSLNESFGGIVASTGAMGSGIGSGAAQPLGTSNNFGVNDMRLPQVIIPIVRRIFPELLAHKVVGVQPMNGPVGFAFALRSKYGVNRGGVAGDTSYVGQEIGYNNVNTDHTGKSAGSIVLNTALDAARAAYLASYALTGDDADVATAPLLAAYDAALLAAGHNPALDKSASYSTAGQVSKAQGQVGLGLGTVSAGAMWNAFANGGTPGGVGADLATSEWWKIGEDMPMVTFGLEKSIIEAKSRKLGSHWSLELAEDMMNMHGVNAEDQMVDIMSYELQAEIDRQLLGEMVKAALAGVAGSHYSTWTPSTADGRHQQERISALYTHLLISGNKVAINSRRGPANFAFADTTTCALLERCGDFTVDNEGDKVAAIGKTNVGISKAGAIRHGSINLYRDTFSNGNYMLLGYKGATAYDSGIIYCPYIPLSTMSATGTQDFTPRMGVRTRYGVANNLFGAANYYHYVHISGLSTSFDPAANRSFIA